MKKDRGTSPGCMQKAQTSSRHDLGRLETELERRNTKKPDKCTTWPCLRRALAGKSFEKGGGHMGGLWWEGGLTGKPRGEANG